MLFVLFQIGRDRYALEAGRVVEVLPLVSLQKIPRAPRGVAGLFNYRGQLVPAVDLCELATGTPAREQLSTRILLVQPADATGRPHLLGLIAERAAEMIRVDGRQVAQTGPRVGQVPWLGPVLMDGAGVIQCLREQQLLTDEVRALLFTPHEPPPPPSLSAPERAGGVGPDDAGQAVRAQPRGGDSSAAALP